MWCKRPARVSAILGHPQDIDHTKTKAKSPQTNGICERFHRTTIQDEFYAIAFRKKIYRSIAELQADLDRWMYNYNNERTHTGKYCFGKTPMQTFIDSILLAKEKLLETLAEDQILSNKYGLLFSLCAYSSEMG